MNRTVKSLVTAVGLTVGALTLNGNVAHASAITGLAGSVYGTGSSVTVDILPSFSGFDNEINFFYAWTDTSQNLTDKTVLGIDDNVDRIDLGIIELGKELVFGITSRQGTFLTGSGSRNPDGRAHAIVSAAPPADGFTESWLVGFEDLFGGGDNDFNDAVFRISQRVLSVPEPGPAALLLIGMLGLGASRRLQR